MGSGENTGENVGTNTGTDGRILAPAPSGPFEPTFMESDFSQYPLNTGVTREAYKSYDNNPKNAGIHYFNHDWTRVSSPAAPTGSDAVMRCRKPAGAQTYGGNIRNIDFTAEQMSIVEGDEYWLSFYVYFPSASGWANETWTAAKFSRWEAFTGFKLAHVRLEDGEEFDFTNSNRGGFVTFGTWEQDVWIRLEIYVRFSSSDPITRVYKNGDLILEDPLPTLTGNLANPGGITRIQFVPETNGGTLFTKQMDLYYSRIILTDGRNPPPNTDASGNPVIGDY